MLKDFLHYKTVFITILTSVVIFGGLALADPALAGFIGKHPALDTVVVVVLHLLRVIEQTLTGTAPSQAKR